MARRGKVSKGCQTCRRRKIKCDQIKPSCTQCLNAGWKCPKYDDALDRIFQHQTFSSFTDGSNPSLSHLPVSSSVSSKLVEKAQTEAQVLYDKNSVSHFHLDTGTIRARSLTQRTEPQYPLGSLYQFRVSTPAKERAIIFFLSAHVFHESTNSRGHFEYLAALYSQSADLEPLSISLNAVALAAFANIVKSSKLLIESRRNLVLAIRSVNAALNSRQDVTKDGTLSAVLLLGTFEAITGLGMQSVHDCDTHVAAATTLMRLRGYQQFQSRTGLQLFLQLASTLVISCMRRGVTVPPDVITFREHAACVLDTNDPSWRLSGTLIRLCELQASMKGREHSQPSEIIAIALDIDDECTSLSTSMPVEGQFETVLTDLNPQLVFMRICHIYSDICFAHIWNSICILRMTLHKIICSQLQAIHITNSCSNLAVHPIQKELSLTIIAQMAFDVCASIPQYAGDVLLISESCISSPRRSSNSRQTRCPLKVPLTEQIPTATGTYGLLWQLLIAGEAATSSFQQDWIINRLRYLGNTTGIHQTFLVANALERGEEMKWK